MLSYISLSYLTHHQVLDQLKRDPRIWVRWLSGYPKEEMKEPAASGQKWQSGKKRKKAKNPPISGVRSYHQAEALVLHRASMPSTVGGPEDASRFSAASEQSDDDKTSVMLEDIWKMDADDRIRVVVGWLSQLKSRWAWI